MRQDLEKKKLKQQEERRRNDLAAATAAADQKRAAAATETASQSAVTFQYSNGDLYVGELKSGAPHGFGKMQYSDDGSDRLENSLVTYEGDWVDGKHHGKGKKYW